MIYDKGFGFGTGAGPFAGNYDLRAVVVLQVGSVES